MAAMNGREIAERAFACGETPRVPVTLVGGGAWAVDKAGQTFGRIKNDPVRIAEILGGFSERFHLDLLWSGSNFVNYPIHALGCPLQDDSSDSPGLHGSAIPDLSEIGLLSIEKVLRDPTVQSILQAHRLIADRIGQETLIIPTYWAPFTTAARILGVENTLAATIESPDRLLELVGFATEMIWALVEPVVKHADIRGANFSDPVASGDLISPAMFRRFAAPSLKELVRRLRGLGKYAMIHICGDTNRILPDVAEIGPHCFSLESKVELGAAKKILGGKVCVAGNVSPTGPFLSGTPEEVIAEAQACLEAWGNAPGYLLTVGCDFSKNVPEENMKALMSFKKGA